MKRKNASKKEYDDDFFEDVEDIGEDTGVTESGDDMLPGGYGYGGDVPDIKDDEFEKILAENRKKGDVGEAELQPNLEDPITMYIAEIRKYKVLDRDEELKLCEAAKKGDSEALETLINSNQKLVLAIALRKFRGKGLGIEDLVSAGNEGLRAGIAAFDPSKGARLATYVSYHIIKTMRRAVYNMGSVIRLPENMHIDMGKVIDAEEKYRARTGEYPDIQTISAMSGVKESQVRKLLYYKALQFVSLDALSGDENDTPFIEKVADEDDSRRVGDAEEIIGRYLSKLDDRERRIIKSYYGLFGEEKKNLSELAKEFGLATQRISQIKIQAERKLEKSGMVDELRMLY